MNGCFLLVGTPFLGVLKGKLKGIPVSVGPPVKLSCKIDLRENPPQVDLSKIIFNTPNVCGGLVATANFPTAPFINQAFSEFAQHRKCCASLRSRKAPPKASTQIYQGPLLLPEPLSVETLLGETAHTQLMLTPDEQPLFINIGGVPGFSGDSSFLEGNTPLISRGLLIRGQGL